MTHEMRATWIGRAFLLFLAVGVGVGVCLYPKPNAATTAANTEAAVVEHDLEIIHYHLPANPESEQIADILGKVGKKYGAQVLVTRVDIAANPAAAAAEKVTKPPKVVMMAGTVRACKFQGLWTQTQIERKVEEILRGLKRVGKDWRPDVKGMQPATETVPPPP